MAEHNNEEVFRLAEATLESVRNLRETQRNDGGDEDTPLVTGAVPAMEVAECLFSHPNIDRGLRQCIMWTPLANDLHALVVCFSDDGEREAVNRIAYQCSSS